MKRRLPPLVPIIVCGKVYAVTYRCQRPKGHTGTCWAMTPMHYPKIPKEMY